jgi:uncharacterized protein YkwD
MEAPMARRVPFATLLRLGLPLLLAACAAPAGIEDTAPAAGMPASRVEADLVRLMNEQRSRKGLPPLAPQPKLSSAALAHSRIMGQTGCLAFECAGMSVDRRIAGNGYRYGESRSYIGAGYDNAGAALSAMMSRKWGREMVLDPAFRHVGVGYVFAGGAKYRHYWTISFATPANGDFAALAAAVIRLTNEERRKRGLPPLAQNRNLMKSAQSHADFMARNDCFAHRCPKEPALAQRAKNAGYGYRSVAENIAAGSPTPAEVVEGWMNSPGHRANILRPEMREIGIGYALLNEDPGKETYRHYWVQNFGYR